ncbi:MAG: hypothetical protein Q8P67_24985 [archaeon]|nr:hypothetical protein [archaeon]
MGFFTGKRKRKRKRGRLLFFWRFWKSRHSFYYSRFFSGRAQRKLINKEGPPSSKQMVTAVSGPTARCLSTLALGKQVFDAVANPCLPKGPMANQTPERSSKTYKMDESKSIFYILFQQEEKEDDERQAQGLGNPVLIGFSKTSFDWSSF